MIIGVSGLSGSGKDAVADLLVAGHGAVKLSLADPIKRICADAFGWDANTLWGPSARRNALDLNYPREHTWKEGVCACCGFDVGAPETKDLEIPEQCFLSARYALQKLGSEWARDCYPDVWIDYAVRAARALLKEDLGELKAEKIHATRTYSQQRGIDYCSYDENREPRAVVVPDVRFKNEIYGLKYAGAKLVRVKRPGHDQPKWDHQSETEQLQVPDSEFDYVLQNDGTLEQLQEKVEDMMKELSK